MGNDLDLVLLIGTVTTVHAGGRIETVGERGGRHVRTVRDAQAGCSVAGCEVLPLAYTGNVTMIENLHSPQRRLIELDIEHADLNSLIDRLGEGAPLDDLLLRRLKKRRLLLRDQIAQLAAQVDPPEPA